MFQTHFVVDSGIVYKRVNAAMIVDSLCYGLCTSLRSRKVGENQPASRSALSQIVLQPPPGIGVAIDDDCNRAFSGACANNGRTDSFCSPVEDDHFVF